MKSPIENKFAQLAFRPAAAAEADALNLFVNAAYRGESSKKGWTTEADLLGGQRTDAGKIAEMIAAADSRIELAHAADGELVGCMYLRNEKDACYLGMLTVKPELQAAGIGKQLMIRSEEIARAWGCGRMRMTVIQLRKELIEYYERRGYVRSGKTEPFPNDPRFGLPKTRLEFIELVKPLN